MPKKRESAVSATDAPARVQASFERQGLMATLGATLQAVDPTGAVAIAMPFSADLTQQDGFIHAGAIAAIMDSACGYAALTLMPPGAEVLTVEFKTNYLRPATGTYFIASGTVIKPGRTIIVAEGRALAFGGADDSGGDGDGDDRTGKLIATMTATLMVMQSN